MNYSFTQPEKKTILKKVSRIWWGYIFLTLFIFLGFVVMLRVQGYFMQQSKKAAIAMQEQMLQQIKEYQETMLTEEEKVHFYSHLNSQNKMLQESVESLFDLIPEQITLNKIQMEQTQLSLYGTTPSKQIYTFLLEVPLRSIFHQSRADFYMLPNGWYNFVSISKLNQEEAQQ